MVLQGLLKNSGAIMNQMKKEQRTQIISALAESSRIRSTACMCEVAPRSVLNLLPQIGAACLEYQDEMLHNEASA